MLYVKNCLIRLKLRSRVSRFSQIKNRRMGAVEFGISETNIFPAFFLVF